MTREVRSLLQPSEMLAAWTAIATAEREARNLLVAREDSKMRLNRDLYRCHHCNDIGYQIAIVRRQELKYTAARGCVCAFCPPAQRSDFPLTEPVWKLDRLRGLWDRIEPKPSQLHAV